jgi:hypothetical protein
LKEVNTRDLSHARCICNWAPELVEEILSGGFALALRSRSPMTGASRPRKLNSPPFANSGQDCPNAL